MKTLLLFLLNLQAIMTRAYSLNFMIGGVSPDQHISCIQNQIKHVSILWKWSLHCNKATHIRS